VSAARGRARADVATLAGCRWDLTTALRSENHRGDARRAVGWLRALQVAHPAVPVIFVTTEGPAEHAKMDSLPFATCCNCPQGMRTRPQGMRTRPN